MTLLASVLAMIVAIEHVYILYLEMFNNTSETASKTFSVDMSYLKDERTQTLFKNQGLYNGFLAVGIIYGVFWASNSVETTALFLIFVVVASLYGGLTSSKMILVKQGLPAILALLVLFIY